MVSLRWRSDVEVRYRRHEFGHFAPAPPQKRFTATSRHWVHAEKRQWIEIFCIGLLYRRLWWLLVNNRGNELKKLVLPLAADATKQCSPGCGETHAGELPRLLTETKIGLFEKPAWLSLHTRILKRGLRHLCFNSCQCVYFPGIRNILGRYGVASLLFADRRICVPLRFVEWPLFSSHKK